MLLVAISYYLLSVGSDLPVLQLEAGFVDVQSFPALSRLHKLGVVSAPGAVPWLICGNGKVAAVQGFNSCN
jgi:hypothetical protein|nr:MAG TPA: hypothetical protein [Caudoviricetes sp.]